MRGDVEPWGPQVNCTMQVLSVFLGTVGVVLALLGFARYARSIALVAVAKRPTELQLLVYGGGLIALTGVAVAWGGEASLVLPVGLAALPVLLTPALFWLLGQRHIPLGELQVRVGERLPDFEAQTDSGDIFRTENLAGQRVLLKFFRGEWCPFCSAELKAFQALLPDLERLGVTLFALSKDTPEAAARHRARDGLTFTLLCDPELRVIRQFGLEHKQALQMAEGRRVTLFGMEVGTQPEFRSMAIPTTLLIDEQGAICWIDQTDDYRVRSQPERVLSEIAAAL